MDCLQYGSCNSFVMRVISEHTTKLNLFLKFNGIYVQNYLEQVMNEKNALRLLELFSQAHSRDIMG